MAFSSPITPAFVQSLIQDTISRIDLFRVPDDITSVILRLEYLNEALVNSDQFTDRAVSTIGEVLSILRDVANNNQPNTRELEVRSLRRGRSPFDRKEEQLAFLVENGFKVPQISQLLGASIRTVERGLSAFGIKMSGKFSNIGDEELDQVVESIQQLHPGVGLRMLKGHLESRGLMVQRERIRQSHLRTDPTGVLQRWRQSIR
ncbi:hypothetical protein P5673_030505 [Acropora cervicornis]|uniref:Uncharacterized protein n=1 Tax=Acropora cervicornis TaxID=6130 RepID=A0AAD9PU39_ACRCE|nr:hypothetical protein P5673_030505 [Acropora cervicornis]